MTNTQTTVRLYDANTGDDLGPATPEQVAASDASEAKGELGYILVDADGDVVAVGSAGARTVYTA